ncbi:DUF11 domain-containing protein [Pedobacter sp. HMF7647]|uniref:DUF11 domain-containing protein n=1 Tax=Hufsiella arboris TaxID=2695275 RepID=A0A7K1YGG8_9SPHI|nr:PKD domain-containing protein [Hufsiella arboris]MXV53308.1 DUF11 domain-containing protein [Hufsiella arboris]
MDENLLGLLLKRKNIFATSAKIVGVLTVLMALSVSLHAQFTISRTFTDNNAIGLTLGGTAHLTAGNEDPYNEGWLRLTSDQPNQVGYLTVDQSFPSSLGVFIDFEYITWRSQGPAAADGFSIFLYDPTVTPFQIGAFGGGLGYSQKTDINSGNFIPGLSGGFIGLGIDEFGNYSSTYEQKTGGIGGGFYPSTIGLRGNQASNYNYLGGTNTLTPTINYLPLTSVRPASTAYYRRIQLSIEKINATQYQITAFWKTSETGAFTKLFGPVNVDNPPPVLKLGFAGSTGGGVDYHEIRNLIVTTPGNLRVLKTVDKPTARLGDELAYTVTAYNDTDAPLNGINLTDQLPDSRFFQVESIDFSNDGYSGNTASGYTMLPQPSMDNVTLNMVAKSTSTFNIKGHIIAYPYTGEIRNNVDINVGTSGITDSDLTNNSSSAYTVVLTPNLDLKVEPHYFPCQQNQNIDYIISLSNVGNAATAGQVTVTQDLPPDLGYIGARGDGWTIDFTGNQIIATRTDGLALGYFYPPITVSLNSNPSTPNQIKTRVYVENVSDVDLGNNEVISDIYLSVPPNLVINPGVLALVCPDPFSDNPPYYNLTLPALTNGSNNGNLTYWTNPEATIPLSNPQQVTTPGTYYIKLTNQDGCFTVKPVTLEPLRKPRLVVHDPPPICEGQYFKLTDPGITQDSDPGIILRYYMDPQFKDEITNPESFTTTTQGDFPIYVTARDASGTGCISAKQLNLRVIPKFDLIIYSYPTSQVVNDTFNFSYWTNTYDENTIYDWDFGDGKSSSQYFPNHTYDEAGTYTVTLTMTKSGCQVSATQTVIVSKDPNIVPKFSVDQNPQCLEGNSFIFTDATVNRNNTLFYYNWDFGDGQISIEQNPVHAYTSAGIYTVTLTVLLIPGFQLSTTQTVVVTERPTLNPITNQVLCNGQLTTAVNFSSADIGTQYTWTNDHPEIGLPGNGTDDLFPFQAVNNTSSPIVANITVTPEADGCIGDPQTFTITVNPSAIASDISVSGITEICSGGSTTLTATSKIPGADFKWYLDSRLTQQVETGPTFYTSVLEADVVYYVTVSGTACENQEGQALQVLVHVKQPATPALIDANDQTVCSGQSVTLSAIPSGNVTNPVVTWYKDAGTTTPLGTGLTYQAGMLNATTAFYVTIQGSNYCENRFNPKVVTVTVNPKPDFTVTNPPKACANAKVDITSPSVVSGQGNLTFNYFQYSNGSVPIADPTAITSSGTYYVRATSPEGCTSDLKPVVVTINPALAINYNTFPVNCYGTATGQILLGNIQGGTPPFTYTFQGQPWSGDTGRTLSPGTYSFTITDAAGCVYSYTSTVETRPAIVINPTVANAGCIGQNNGAISIQVSGGSNRPDQYSFTWRGPNNYNSESQNISGLAPGPYRVTVVDAFLGCSKTMNIDVLQNPPVVINPTVTDITCNGNISGAINLTVSGGSEAGYTYSWTGPGGFTSTAQNISGLGSGTYTVTVTDNQGCNSSISKTINEPSAISISETHIDASAPGTATGSITTIVSGGTAPYSFLWTRPPAFTSTAQSITELITGDYTLTVTDANGCTATIKVFISEPNLISIAETTASASCNNGSDGRVDLTVSGGTPPYTFAWTGPNGYSASTEDISGLSAGAYTVQVTDASGQVHSITATVGEPSNIDLTAAITNINCTGGNTGAISLTASGGPAGSYAFAWTGPNGYTGSGASIANLAEGTYTVTVTDGSCSSSESYQLLENAPILITPTVVNNVCPGSSQGSASLAVIGGSGVYTYSWTGPNGFASTSQNLTGLASGYYDVTVTDALGCSAIANVTVSESPSFIAEPVITNVTCNGAANGAIALTVSLGAPAGFAFAWTGPNGFTASTENISNIRAGKYQVIITSGAGCTQTYTYDVGEPQAIQVASTITPATCAGASTGAINLTASGGSGSGYTFNWTGPNGFTANTQNITGIVAGTYFVTTTDGASCNRLDTLIVPQSAPIVISSVIDSVLCAGSSTGDISISVSGGIGSYTYSWTGPDGFTAATANVNNVKAGSYTVTVTDSAGCSAASQAIVIPDAVPITLSLQATDASCAGSSGGSIISTVSGGRPPYVYGWSTGARTKDLSDLPPGKYRLTVADQNGCTAVSDSVEIKAGGTVNLVTVDQTVCLPQAGDLTAAAVTAGSDPGLTFSYYINPLTTIPVANPAAITQSGVYYIKATNAAGCSAVKPVSVRTYQPPGPTYLILETSELLAGPPKRVIVLQDTVWAGSTVVFRATATNAADYDWFKNGVPVPVDTNVIVVPNVQNSFAGTYLVTCKNPVGCETDQPASVILAVNDLVTWKTVSDASGDGKAQRGEVLTYTIHVRNTGTAALNTITVTDALPLGTSYVSGGTLNGNDVQFSIPGPLAPNAETAVSFSLKVNDDIAGTTISNQALVTTDNHTFPTGTDSDIGNTDPVIIPVQNLADLSIVKTQSPQKIYIGDQFTYQLSATNNGPDDAHNVIVSDVLPAEVDYVPLPTSPGQISYDPATRAVTWTIGTLGTGESTTAGITVQARLQGTATNTATVSTTDEDPVASNNSSTVQKEISGMFIPNVITVNGDGRNDRFVIKGVDPTQGMAIRIYNRWGNEVYHQDNYKNDWDGSQLNEATYYYLLTIGTGQNAKVYKGWIQLLR